VVPPFCHQCGEPFAALGPREADFICEKCAERRWHFHWARSAYQTKGQVLEAIIGFKYLEEHFRRRQLVGWLVEAFDRHAAPETWDALVPVPLHFRRRHERGFNQAWELAHGLAIQRDLRVLDGLYRCRETDTQTFLGRNERWANLAGAFSLKPKFDVTGLHLLIIDDVFTTGATANACAHALVRGGAGYVSVLTVARS
jgi:ComF family protein